MRKQFLSLTVVCPGLHWQEDAAGSSKPAGTRPACHKLAAHMANATLDAAQACTVSPGDWVSMAQELARADCFVQDNTSQRVFRPRGARAPSQAHCVAANFRNYTNMRALKRAKHTGHSRKTLEPLLRAYSL